MSGASAILSTPNSDDHRRERQGERASDANGTVGGYTVTASIAGGASATFSLANTGDVCGEQHARPDGDGQVHAARTR